MNPPGQAVVKWINHALALVYPEVCQICAEERARPEDGFVCSHCWSKAGALRFIRPPFCERCGLPYEGDLTTEFVCSNCHDVTLHFSSARSAVVSSGLAKDVIHRFKYSGHVWFEPFLTDLLLRELIPWLAAHPDWDTLVPVPLHPVKQRERGFNQADRIARAVARRTGLEPLPNALKRVKETQTQTVLSRDQRAANMRKAFALNGRNPLNGRRVILIDDVFTTGATTNACARALRDAGAANVCVWTVARGI